MTEQLFSNNLHALQSTNPALAEKIKAIETNSRFEVFAENLQHPANIRDNNSGELLYKDPIKELEVLQRKWQKFTLFPYLFFFGVGNGYVFKLLLQNSTHKKITVIEPEIELLYVVLNLIDFSQEIASKRLELFEPTQLTFSSCVDYLLNEIFMYIKTYELTLHLPYYQHYQTEITHTNTLLLKAFVHIIQDFGNDPADSLMGLENHIKNLPDMLKSNKLQDLMVRKNSDVAVIVATGPSLQKQLSTLKEIAPYVTIISVDASFPILEKNGIVPDIATSVERIEDSAVFFEHTSESFQKNTVKVIASVTHPKTNAAIKARENTIFFMRAYTYCDYFDLKAYGHVEHGPSAANIAHGFAYDMGFKTCILIGQDLAFGDDGMTHTKGNIWGEQESMYEVTDLLTEKYGGGGKVQTTVAWNYFRDYFEIMIAKSSHKMTTINATEGGARIHGALEIPFSQAIQGHVTKAMTKKPIILPEFNADEYRLKLVKSRQKIAAMVCYLRNISKKAQKVYSKLTRETRQMNALVKKGKTKKIKLSKVQQLNDELNRFKDNVYSKEFEHILHEFTKQIMLHQELDLLKITTKHYKTEEEYKAINIEWMSAHEPWLQSLELVIEQEIATLRKAYNTWRLKEKGSRPR